jgi:hypothetical protein
VAKETETTYTTVAPTAQLFTARFTKWLSTSEHEQAKLHSSWPNKLEYVVQTSLSQDLKNTHSSCGRTDTCELSPAENISRLQGIKERKYPEVDKYAKILIK